MAKEEWIVVRGKSQLNMNTFIVDWTETLNKVPTTSLIVRLLRELQEYKVSFLYIQGNQSMFVHLIITVQKNFKHNVV